MIALCCASIVREGLGAQSDKAGVLHRHVRGKGPVLGLGWVTLQVWVEERWWMLGRGVGAWEWQGVLWASFLAKMEQEHLEKSFPVVPRVV